LVPGALSPEVKRPGPEADYSPPTSAEVKIKVDLYIHSPIHLHGVVLNYLRTGTALLSFNANMYIILRITVLKKEKPEWPAGLKVQKAENHCTPICIKR
jgi:hypothetical protein